MPYEDFHGLSSTVFCLQRQVHRPISLLESKLFVIFLFLPLTTVCFQILSDYIIITTVHALKIVLSFFFKTFRNYFQPINLSNVTIVNTVLKLCNSFFKICCLTLPSATLLLNTTSVYKLLLFPHAISTIMPASADILCNTNHLVQK